MMLDKTRGRKKKDSSPNKCAVSHPQDIKIAFELFILPSLEQNLLEMIIMEGRRVRVEMTNVFLFGILFVLD